MDINDLVTNLRDQIAIRETAEKELESACDKGQELFNLLVGEVVKTCPLDCLFHWSVECFDETGNFFGIPESYLQRYASVSTSSSSAGSANNDKDQDKIWQAVLRAAKDEVSRLALSLKASASDEEATRKDCLLRRKGLHLIATILQVGHCYRQKIQSQNREDDDIVRQVFKLARLVLELLLAADNVSWTDMTKEEVATTRDILDDMYDELPANVKRLLHNLLLSLETN